MVTVKFDYEPDQPDDDDPTGISSDEYDDLTMKLMELFGANDIQITKA